MMVIPSPCAWLTLLSQSPWRGPSSSECMLVGQAKNWHRLQGAEYEGAELHGRLGGPGQVGQLRLAVIA